MRGYLERKVRETSGRSVECERQQVQLPLFIVEKGTKEHEPALFGCDWLAAVKVDWTILHQIT